MVEVMKIMATSFKRSRAHTAALNAPDPAADHRRPTPPPETPGHSQASLSQSLVRSLLLSPGSWCTQGSVCALQAQLTINGPNRQNADYTAQLNGYGDYTVAA